MSESLYLRLDVDQIVSTMGSLKMRIDNRFPESGLGKLCGELLEVGKQADEFIDTLRRPIYGIRAFSWFLIVLLILLGLVPFALAFSSNFWTDLPTDFGDMAGFIEAYEATLNEMVLMGVAVIFLATGEARIKRKRTLSALRNLRSIAHVVDMHQLTKDPKDLLAGDSGSDEGMETMSREDLAHYLDYCSEVLALTSKIAALYLQGFHDHVVIGAVNEIESLTSGLSGKIWRKIMILDQVSMR